MTCEGIMISEPLSRLAGKTAAVLLVAALWVTAGVAAEKPEVAGQQLLLKGEYQEVIKTAQTALRASPDNSEWGRLLVQALLEIGRYSEADSAMKTALERDASSLRLRWLARDVAFANGRPAEAKERIEEIRRLLRDRPWMYRNPVDMVIFGRAALMLGADPKDVLEKVFGAAQKAEPKLREIYLARGELALEKHDFPLAAKAFEEGLKVLPEDPDLLFGRGRAYAGGEREVSISSYKAALALNPRHVPSLLQLADHAIDSEDYTEAAKRLDEVIAINPLQPDAWAYRAVLAHLRYDATAESAARTSALSSWPENPRVDFLIGQKLAAKYRFAEAAAYQRRARAFDPTYLPASAELAQNLLRLGEEAEGWALAQAVHERDEYDVEAFNLVTLRETMAKYASLTTEDFVVRMAAPEVAVYGPRVLALLRRASKTLTEKYGAELQKPTYVEIFADQKDFAVRTFGLPDVPGFLGVCFGRLVTANSPATSTRPTNWESVLWHEFCHVVTLQMTKNRMPRWLSEGISVYEERQANPAWGMRLDSSYREMIENGDLAPVGQLSAAFLAPKSSKHLQFAYLQSSMVVEFIVDRFGLPALRGILTDLRSGVAINAALAKNTLSLEKLEKDFAAHAAALVKNFAPGLDWEKPDPVLLTARGEKDLLLWERGRPNNFWVLRYRAAQAAEAQRWQEAKKPLQRLIELYPQQKGSDNAYRSLVAAHRALGETKEEREVLRRWVEVDDEAPDAYLRLMELATHDRDWPTVEKNVQRYLAVNPLVAPPYRYLAEASGATGQDSEAIVAWRTLLQLDAGDPAETHFRLADILRRRGEVEDAKYHVLLALEDTPRYREALRLLRELKQSASKAEPVTPAAAAPSPLPVNGVTGSGPPTK